MAVCECLCCFPSDTGTLGFVLDALSSALMVFGVVTICIAKAAATRSKGLRPFFSVSIRGRSRRSSESSQTAFAASTASTWFCPFNRDTIRCLGSFVIVAGPHVGSEKSGFLALLQLRHGADVLQLC